jgi:glycosyltransferase involved in cell wall biosynthesis
MTTVNKSLLFVGVSSMRNHAGQDKLYFLADEFGRKGTPVTVLVPDLRENRDFFADKPHVEARFYPKGNALADAWNKTRVVRESKWSAIWLVGVGLRSCLVRAKAARHIPIIKDFDEFPSMITSLSPFRRAYLRWIENRMVEQADGFTCASAFIEQSIRQRRPDLGNRLLRLPVAISADEHRVDPALVDRLRRAAEGRPIFLYVGSVSRIYQEQIDEVIQLAQVLRRRNSRARVRIAGSGPDMDYYKAKAAAAKVGEYLEFTGHVRRQGDLAAHMEAAHVLIFPFPANPFNISRCPTKAFHYAAANRPVVTNRTGEVAALFGNAALYYPERNAEALADRCLEALARVRGFDNGIAFSTLTWETRARQFMDWLAAQGWIKARPRSHALEGKQPGRPPPPLAAAVGRHPDTGVRPGMPAADLTAKTFE